MVECEYNSQCAWYEICAPDNRCRRQCQTNRDCRDGTVCTAMDDMRVCAWPADAGAPDAGAVDDSGVSLPRDSGTVDAGTTTETDAGGFDAGMTDSGMMVDAGPPDAGGMLDAGPTSVGPAPPPLLVAGDRFTCAVRASVLRCWGDNTFGQLGDMGGTFPSFPGTLSNIAAGPQHACVVTTNGLYCWGSNADGQLGNGTSGGSNSTPQRVGGLTAPTLAAGGAGHTCAIHADGSVSCWGANSAGQLGDGTIASRLVATSTQPLAAPAAQITARSTRTCVLLNDGRVQCWGSGYGSTPTLISGLTDIVEVRTGSTFTCARRSDGAVLCWGDNSYGQLGNNTMVPRSTPDVVNGIPPMIELGVGGGHICALTQDETVYCWGHNVVGQAGQNHLIFMGDKQLVPALVNGVTNATEIVAGERHTCVRLANDDLLCWGRNDYSQLGDPGSTTDSYMPVRVMW
jgi:alpha-tubulin suppressor-like RCC1 family protein